MGNDSKKLIKKVQSKIHNWLSGKKDSELRAMSKASSPEKLLELFIPEKVAESPDQDEPKKLILNFIYFDVSICNFQKADSAKMSSLLSKLKLITTHTNKSIIGSGLLHDKINKDGDYRELFKHLDDDVEKLDEIKISGYGRIYGFIAGDNFYLIAVDTVHKNIH